MHIFRSERRQYNKIEKACYCFESRYRNVCVETHATSFLSENETFRQIDGQFTNKIFLRNFGDILLQFLSILREMDLCTHPHLVAKLKH